MLNYFNYFTEIEEHFQKKRDVWTRLNSLDWVLVETWKDQGIPLDCVLKGIDRAFSRPSAKRKYGSLAYCAKAIADVCDEQKDLRVEKPVLPEVTADEISGFLEKLISAVLRLNIVFPEVTPKFESIAQGIRELNIANLREAEQTLSALEEKLIALLKVACADSLLIEIRRDVDAELNPFRTRMTTEQLTMLEQQMWRRKLMECFDLSRLSLFYLI